MYNHSSQFKLGEKHCGARRKIDGYLMFYAQSTTKGHIRGKQNVFLYTTSKYSDSQLNTHSTVENLRNLGKMKLNEPGRQKLG